MQEFITIEKDPNLETSQDFNLLREAGLKHIEALGSELWTDYNSHDPGITLLEVLAYAITDLGYRTGNDIKDILTEGSDELNNHISTFHKATQILPCNQVTELDLREILIDVVGVRNAWIKISNKFENSYFTNFDTSELTHTDPLSATKNEVLSLNGLYHIVVEFDRLAIPIDNDVAGRLEKEQEVLFTIKERLMKYRNFCEDYFVKIEHSDLSNTPVTEIIARPEGFEKIVIWGDVEVESDADMEKVHAQIYFDIEQFLIPYVTFYSLKERLDQGATIDEIFEGPLLTNGFINEDELAEIELREVIHTSDLYQVMMDVPGVKAVKSMKIASYLSEDGLVHNETDTDILDLGGQLDLKKLLSKRGEEWTLQLKSSGEDCKFYELVLDSVTANPADKINKTIKFYTGENSVPVTIDTLKTLDELNIFRQNDRKRRERLSQSSFELEVPVGEHLDLGMYYPAQNELPEVYGTGLSGLSDDVTDERKAQAKQLKGYLLLFEQILTNYLAQLQNVRHLFSWDDTIDKTYYTQLLIDVKNRDELYVEEYDGDNLAPGGVLYEPRLAELIQADAESPTVYYDRRSRFLNHLIARFNEKFVEYTMVMHSLGLKDRVITDKTNFLKEYDLISLNRGKAFDYSLMRQIPSSTSTDYFEPDVWDTKNVTGYQHRLCRFLGITDESRRFLYSGHDMRIDAEFTGTNIQYRYVLTINKETGLEVYGTFQDDATDAIQQFDDFIENQGKENIEDDITNPLQAIFKKLDSPFDVYGETSLYATAAELVAVLVEINSYFDNVVSYITDVVDLGGGVWNFTLQITDAVSPFNVVGPMPGGFPSELAAETALADLLNDLDANNIAFSMPPDGMVTLNAFYFILSKIDTGDTVAQSDLNAFVGDKDAAIEGKNIAQTFLSEAIGYIKSESGLHVVEHILLRAKTDDVELMKIDVKQYDSINTVENPPVAYPLDYDGLYKLDEQIYNSDTDEFDTIIHYKKQYSLSSEVELTSASLDNEFGEKVITVEPYFYTLTTNQNETEVATNVTWEDLFAEIQDDNSLIASSQLQNGVAAYHDLNQWNQLVAGGSGCSYANYVIGTVNVNSTTIHYYLIVDDFEATTPIILGGLAMLGTTDITINTVKERALRAFAYFCDNNTCKGISNPYEFRATVVLPAWTSRAKDYNYRKYAEDTIRLEAPAHIAMDIFWLNRAQMKEFELCYREWLIRQGDFLYLNRLIQQSVEPEVTDPDNEYVSGSEPEAAGLTAPTNLSNQFLLMNESANCVIEKIGTFTNVYQSIYETVTRNEDVFDSATTEGYVLAWLSDSADGSEVNKAEIVAGVLPDFLGFYDGEDLIPQADPLLVNDFAAGDFVIIDHSIVEPGSWQFSVKTYSDSGQVSCADVLITIIQDLEAVYTNDVECYNDLIIGRIVSEIQDDNDIISTAELLEGTMPAGLLLLIDATAVASFASAHGLNPNDYQPGDIVVNALMNNPVNDPLAVASPVNLVPNLKIKLTDITGGSTILTSAKVGVGSNVLTNIVQILGNAPTIVASCSPKNLGTYNLANTIYTGALSDVLLTFTDGHFAEGITYSSASINVGTPSTGIDVRVNADGEVEIFVDDFALFESYVNAQTPMDATGKVVISITELLMIDSCGFVDTWSGNVCVIQNREPQVVEHEITCAGALLGAPLVTITDADLQIARAVIDPSILAHFTSLGIVVKIGTSTNLTSPPATGALVFSVANKTTFLAGIQNASNYPVTATVSGVQVRTYVFDLDVTDGYGTESTISTRIIAPINQPFECIETYPSGTSYLAYLNSTITWSPNGASYSKYVQTAGKTVMSFTDPNGIQSISCSCKKCNGQPFGIDAEVFVNDGVIDFAVVSQDDYGFEVMDDSLQVKSANNPVQAKMGSPAPEQSMKFAEKASKVNSSEKATSEKIVIGTVKGPSYTSPPPECTCLTSKGLALDKVGNRIYVANSSLFQANGIGTLRFSITITDKCGIISCKDITFVIGNDKPATYIDVKNKSYLNALNNGDIIGYPIDPDGAVTGAQIVLYNDATKAVASPVNPSLELPPGTQFNTITGEIRVVSVPSSSVGVYTEAQPQAKSALGSGTAQKGTTIFKKSSQSNESSGIAKMSADSNKTPLAIPLVEGKQPFTEFEAVGTKLTSPLLPNVWITNSGVLRVGKWTIYVMTTDVFGGTTIIKYTIEIKKSAIISGVSGNIGFSSFTDVKSTIKSNYSAILKTSNVSISSDTVINTTEQNG